MNELEFEQIREIVENRGTWRTEAHDSGEQKHMANMETRGTWITEAHVHEVNKSST